MAPNQVTGPITIQLCGQLPPKIGCLLVAFPHRTGMLVYRMINHSQIGSSIVNHPFWGIPSVGNGWPSTSNRSSILQPWPRFHRNNQPWLSASTTNIGRPLATMPGKKNVIDWLQVDSKLMMGDEFMLQPIDETTSSTYGWIWYIILNYIYIHIQLYNHILLWLWLWSMVWTTSYLW